MTLDERLEALTHSLELHELEMADIRREGVAMRADLRRAFAMGVREARHERSRRRALEEKMDELAAAQLLTDEKITQLAAAQMVTEEKLQAFLNSMRRGGNGNP